MDAEIEALFHPMGEDEETIGTAAEQKHATLAWWICVIAACFYCLIGGYLFYRTHVVPEGYLTTQGHITYVGTCGLDCQTAHITFQTTSGTSTIIQVESIDRLVAASNDEQVFVYYRPDKPSEAVAVSFTSYWYYPLASFWFALAWLAGGYAYSRYRRFMHHQLTRLHDEEISF